MKIVFMGTPDFGIPAIRALRAAGHKIIAVYTRAPKPAGHGMHEQLSPVHREANALGIPVFCPPTLRDEKTIRQFKKLKADLAVVAAYGLILPEDILSAPKHGCWNIHASLLPKWRGAAPIQRAIQQGDTKTGVTIMQMDKGLDTGDILAQKAIDLPPDMTGGQLHDILAELGAMLLVKTIKQMPKPVPQDERKALYAPKLDKDEMFIDWNLTPEHQLNFIRAMNPFPGAFCFVQDPFRKGQLLRLRILNAEIMPDIKVTRNQQGHLLDNHLTVATGHGAIRIKTLQRAGRGVQTAEDFLNGTPLPVGTRLTGRASPSLTFILNVDSPVTVSLSPKKTNPAQKKHTPPVTTSKKKEIRSNIQGQFIFASLIRKSRHHLFRLMKWENDDTKGR